MAIEFGSRTSVGRIRKVNEDAFFVTEKDAPYPFIIVCDGMGGHKAGDVASQMAINAAKGEIENGEQLTFREIRNAIIEANHQVYLHAETHDNCAGMGTTLVIAALLPNQVYIANVGDSRAYFYEAATGALRQVTVDHSLVEELLASGQLEPNEIESNPFRNIITRAIGSSLDVKPDLFEVDWSYGDKILLCSDGLTRHVSDQTLLEHLRNNQDTMQQICDHLVDEANRAGGHDNITVVLARNLQGGE